MSEKDPAAVSLGRKGGQKKVAKGFSMLSPKERTELSKKAAKARWGSKKKAAGKKAGKKAK